MAKGQNMSRYQKGIVKRYYENKDTIMIQKLGEIVSDLYVSFDNANKSLKLWERAAAALVNTQVDPVRMAEVLKERNVEGLAKLVSELAGAPSQKSPSAAPPTAQPPPKASPPAHSPQAPPAKAVGEPTAPEQLKRAMKAFRKRMKLTRLDAESELSRSPLSSGKKSAIVAIQPPNQFPNEVWEELVRQGQLKSAGRGFYQLPDS